MSRLHKFCRCERARARLRGANASKACRLHADRQLDLRSQIRRLPCFGAAWRERDANPIAQPEDRRRLSGTRLFTENIDLLLTRVRELSLKGLIAKRAGSNTTPNGREPGSSFTNEAHSYRRLYPTFRRTEIHGRVAGRCQ
jgi:hypothetical protein